MQWLGVMAFSPGQLSAMMFVELSFPLERPLSFCLRRGLPITLKVISGALMKYLAETIKNQNFVFYHMKVLDPCF